MEPHIPRDTKSELELLKRQLQSAIEQEQSGNMRQMTQKEIREGVEKYGHGAICIGDFVIKRR